MAARFTSFSMVTGRRRSWARAWWLPSCQPGRSKENFTSPLRGSTTPGVPITMPFRRDRATLPERQAFTTALCTSATGSPCPLVETVTSATISPLISAMAVVTDSGPTSRPAT